MQSISESLKRQREQILQDTSTEMLSRHTSVLEIAIISLYNRLVNRLTPDTEQFRSSGAVVALENFGRGLIGPNEPIPILLLMAEAFPWKETWLDEITQPLLDAGWTLDLELGTPDQVIERAQKSDIFFMRLLDSRYISGNRQLVDHLDKSLEFLIEGRQEALLDHLHDALRTREMRLESPESWLEPDLMQNPGGLLDIGAIRAACRIVSHIRSLEDAIFHGYLTREEVDFLQQAEKTYTRLLSLLKNVSEDSDGVLRFEEQELLADKLGYSAQAGFLPVENFMRQVYQLFHGVVCISQEFWERVHESRWAGEGREDALEETLEAGLLIRSEKIQLQPEHYSATAGYLVHLFAMGAKHRLGFTNTTRQWIQHHRNTLDTAAGDPMVKQELLELLRLDDPDLHTIRRFYNQGLLTSLVPELAAVHGLGQHDAFHIYPVHEHHLRTLSELKKLMAGDYADLEPELTVIAQGIGDPARLFLAGLLHDLGKSAGKDHALHGGEMIPAIARRLGLTPEESDAVQFLVAQHLLLMDSASLRDLADEEMLAQCALIIGTRQQLDLLVLLSFADMMATGPKAQQKWRDTPVLPLYERVCHLLEKGEPSPRAIAERIERVRAQVGQEVADLIDDIELENYFDQLAPRYLLSMPPRVIARHLRLEMQLQNSGEPLIWEVAESDDSAELTLMSWDSPWLLSRAAGILTMHDMNIHSAQVFTKKNGVVLLIFQCRLREKAESMPHWEAVKEDMKRLLQGKLALDYRIASHAARFDHLQTPVRQTPSHILIDNDSSEMYTILEVHTVDRIGLLYTITRTLLELQIRIYVAKITTKVDQVADVFYIRTQQGDKVTDPEQVEEIKNALEFWLDGPARMAMMGSEAN